MRVHPLVACLSVLLVSACATTNTSGSANAVPTTTKEKIANIGYFDLANCTPAKPELPTSLNKEVIIGALVSQRPYVMECLVDPANRGADKETTVLVDTTVSASGAEHKVAGTNLTPAGTACVQKALANLQFAGVSGLTKPVDGHAEFHHTPSSPAVNFGANDASDIAGTIRLAEPKMCSCFESFGTSAPRPIKLKVAVDKGAKDPNAVNTITPEPTNDPNTDKVASCVAEKTKALSFPLKGSNMTLIYPFLFLNSLVTEPFADSPPDVRFLQLDALRGQRSADTAIKVGARISAVTTYDTLVQKYKAKPASVQVKDLKDKCAALVKSDDNWISSLQKSLDVDKQTLALASELKAKDAQWTEAEAAAQQTVVATQKDIDTATKTKTSDQGVCPKERY